MKRLIHTLLLFMVCLVLNAQTDVRSELDNPSMNKDFNGFILNMGSMLNAESLVVTPLLFPTLGYMPSLADWTPYKLNPESIRITPFLISTLPSFSYGMANNRMNWQGATYKLNNGARINLYGDYNATGYKVYNPSALPWERNNFNAAFEMKSANGNFGIKVEVHGGRNKLY